MTLYEINTRIEQITNPQVDPEPGELLEEIDFDELDALQMAQEEKEINCLLAYKNLVAEADAIAAEKDKLGAREQKIRNRALGLYKYIDRCLDGKQVDDPRVAAKYTESQVTVADADFVKWALDNGHADLVRYKPAPDPEANRVAIKKALKAGAKLEHCGLENKRTLKIG